jgi:hypothetical protein
MKEIIRIESLFLTRNRVVYNKMYRGLAFNEFWDDNVAIMIVSFRNLMDFDPVDGR